jgi:hypothetical protein
MLTDTSVSEVGRAVRDDGHTSFADTEKPAECAGFRHTAGQRAEPADPGLIENNPSRETQEVTEKSNH